VVDGTSAVDESMLTGEVVSNSLRLRRFGR
jgi:cation transport ATPase